MKIKTCELTGAALDWAVAKCEETLGLDSQERFLRDHRIGFTTRYSSTWSQGGPIIEREKISIRQWTNVPVVHAYMPVDDSQWSSDAASPLIAAMRCYVASKLGDEVEVPDELA